MRTYRHRKLEYPELSRREECSHIDMVHLRSDAEISERLGSLGDELDLKQIWPLFACYVYFSGLSIVCDTVEYIDPICGIQFVSESCQVDPRDHFASG